MELQLGVSSLSASYESRDESITVFRSVSFDVIRGGILGIFGPNGSGKTTLLRVIAGLKSPDDGSVALPARNGVLGRIATIPQDYRSSFFDWASLEHNIAFTSSLFPSHPHRTTRATRALRSELGLELDLSLRPRECSGGMLQQATMIRAFQNDPSLILADEPFSALDVQVAAAVRWSFRKKVKDRGIVALVVLHQLQDLAEVCDEVLVIPGRPFSTDPKPGTERASILKNEMLEGRDRQDGLAFVTLAKRVLGKD